MLGRRASPESSMANYDHFDKTEEPDSSRQARPLTRPDIQRAQQPWYPPAYYHHYPGALYQQLPTQRAPGMWNGFDPFDEEEAQRRRNKGKEVVPIRPLNGPPPPWGAYPGGYGGGACGSLENRIWPALLPWQPPPLPPIPLQGRCEYTSRKPTRHVRHDNQRLEGDRRYGALSPEPDIRVNREVDGILTPDSGDLTVHLTMDLEEDLEHHLDEMNRLSRLGHFLSAKDIFNENLRHHIDNPYVLVQYADLLLHQGDLKGVTCLKDDAIYKREGEQLNPEELSVLRLLLVNWELLQILAKSYTLDALTDVPTVFEEAVNVLSAINPDRPISSTEIGILALTIRLAGHPVVNSKWSGYCSRALDTFPTSLFRLYQTLLRQGRIWDFHDLFVLMPTLKDIKTLTYDIFSKDLISSLQVMVSDWSDSVHGYDASTTLGLLSMMTHILLEPLGAEEKECIDILKICLPLAISVAENDPSNLKSRSYLRLLIAKSRFAETASRQAIDSLTSQLQYSQGILYQADISLLPIYVPFDTETPQWTPAEQPAELKNPVRLVLRSAIELGDLETEKIARHELIRLSLKPREEFDMLCTLQQSRQGDLNGYGLTLASKYLVSSTKAEKEDLSIAISRFLSGIASTDYWNSSHEWILNMLLYKLEGRSPSTIQHLLERSHVNYQNVEESLFREISRKMPILRDWVDQQQVPSSTQTKPKSTILRAGSGSRYGNKPSARRTKSPWGRRTKDRLSKREQQGTADERKRERDIPLATSPKPDDNLYEPHPIPEGTLPPVHTVNIGKQSAANQATSLVTVRRFNDNSQGHATPVDMDFPVKNRRKDEAVVAAQIREKLDAEFDKRLEAEKESERERRTERMALLEGLKKEVEAIRREAVEQAERKSRVEARERAEQLRWERQIEEIKLEKEMAMMKADMAAAELDAKFEATRKIAIQEAERRSKEEFDMRKMKENQTRQQAEREISRRIEAEEIAYEEDRAAEKLREELNQKAEVEQRERQDAEEKATGAARMQAEDAEYREKIRQWAAERAERHLENQRNIHFKDAVGRKFMIPFNQGYTWQGMQELIEAAFLHVDVLGPEVRAGHYDLIGPDGMIILPSTWEEIIQPGWNISMHMWPIAPFGPPQPPELAMPASGLSPPPAPSDQSANEEVIVIEELDEDVQDPNEQVGDEASSGHSSSIPSLRPSRARRIANAFSALKTSIFHRRRRASWSTGVASSAPTEELDD
ncbi:hypothetical protein F4782DRAFT_135191 [Xylaria castorea]|nr:hypothetical protein F4782DRAFT_135191 [Xylaria castorea]